MYLLKLDADEVNLIGEALKELPYKKVGTLMTKLIDQVKTIEAEMAEMKAEAERAAAAVKAEAEKLLKKDTAPPATPTAPNLSAVPTPPPGS
jgi:hypothetical protein